MKRTRSLTLPIGVISEGTLRLEDLVSALLRELAPIRLTRDERATVRSVARDLATLRPADDYAEDLNHDYEDLAAIVDNHLPDYAYFGSINGDGACIGIWPNIDGLEDDARDIRKVMMRECRDASVLKINAGDERPNPRHVPNLSHVMEVNDHGNVTLYRRAGTTWREVWSVV